MEETFAQLYASHNTSLNCSCTKGEFLSQDFVTLTVRLHPICSSQFISDRWIGQLFADAQWSSPAIDQFRRVGAIYFVVQQSLCQIAQRAVDRLILELLDQSIFNEKIVSEEQLVSYVRLAFEAVKDWSRDNFRSSMNVGRGGIQTNQLLSSLFSNWMFPSQLHYNRSNYRFRTSPVSHGTDCSCATSSACFQPIYVDEQLLPGFVLACNPIESLLRSTLICLYNQSCLQTINFGNLSSLPTLDRLLPSQYLPNSTVEQLAMGAFIEDWSLNVSYSTFFSLCAPSECIYSVSARKSVLEGITIVLGLYGGLTLILQTLLPQIMAAPQRLAVLCRWRYNSRVISLR